MGVVTIAGALIAGAASLQRLREERFPVPPVNEESLYVTSGATLRRLTAGYSALAADVYWIRAVQYYGSIRLQLAGAAEQPDRTTSAYSLLYPLLDLTTTLDPGFNIAYRFGAIFLAEAYPGGAGRPDLAIALLEKGLRETPDKWQYMQDIGFVHYWWRRDYRAAAEWFRKAGDTPGAPWFLRSLAATTLAEGGDRRSSRLMWESIRQSAEIDWLRREADRRLMQLDAMDFLPGLQDKVDRYTRQFGTPPVDWDALIRARLIPGVPVDPTNTPYEIQPDGRVVPARRSPLYPLPEEPMRNSPPS